jgi:hypothetical protein
MNASGSGPLRRMSWKRPSLEPPHAHGAQVTGGPADITAVRQYNSRAGISVNLEQQATSELDLYRPRLRWPCAGLRRGKEDEALRIRRILLATVIDVDAFLGTLPTFGGARHGLEDEHPFRDTGCQSFWRRWITLADSARSVTRAT